MPIWRPTDEEWANPGLLAELCRRSQGHGIFKVVPPPSWQLPEPPPPPRAPPSMPTTRQSLPGFFGGAELLAGPEYTVPEYRACAEAKLVGYESLAGRLFGAEATRPRLEALYWQLLQHGGACRRGSGGGGGGSSSQSGRGKAVSPSAGLRFVEDNPKRPGSASHERFERYRKASTWGEMRALGGTPADLKHDLKHGLAFLLRPAPEPGPGPDSDRTAAAEGSAESSTEAPAGWTGSSQGSASASLAALGQLLTREHLTVDYAHDLDSAVHGSGFLRRAPGDPLGPEPVTGGGAAAVPASVSGAAAAAVRRAHRLAPWNLHNVGRGGLLRHLPAPGIAGLTDPWVCYLNPLKQYPCPF